MKVNFNTLVEMLLPTFLRGKTLTALLQTLVQPLQTLHDDFQRQAQKDRYAATHTAQICFIKSALNDHYGIEQYDSGFDIDDNSTRGEWLIAYDQDDQQNAPLIVANPPKYRIAADSDTAETGTTHFTVLVPKDISIKEQETIIKTIVNKYRLASRTFTLIYKK